LDAAGLRQSHDLRNIVPAGAVDLGDALAKALAANVLGVTLVMMLLAERIVRFGGSHGSEILIRVMGLNSC